MDSISEDSPAGNRESERLPTRWRALVFGLKASALRWRRWAVELGSGPARLQVCLLAPGSAILGENHSLLFASAMPQEAALQAGKVQNLRVAARCLNGLHVPAGEVFSFWANVPRPGRRGGFALGRELREGCVIPSVGGGLCQLSNALYDAALQAGFEILERHAHTRILPGSSAAQGRDATVFWNYVDLRFRATRDFSMEVTLDARECVVRFHGRGGAMGGMLPKAAASPEGLLPAAVAESCESCGTTSCFRNAAAVSLPQKRLTAWLVDAFQPECDAWMQRVRGPSDWLLIPLSSRKFPVASYRWNTRGFAHLRQARWVVLRRSFISRRLAAQGAARQRALLRADALLAKAFSREIPLMADHLVISQNLLPFLWQAGDLGGRTFDVLMTRLPAAELERRLDLAAAAHPESATLADFRMPHPLCTAEMAALATARFWITPHAEIARLGGGSRAIHLPWEVPAPAPAAAPGRWIVFPASTLGRKGAWELREIARELKLPVRLGGPLIEGADFWMGVETERAGVDWLAGARAVVLPAWVEHQPRRLLAAVAAGVPVIASEACGLRGVAGVTTIPCGDVDALRDAILAV